MATRSYIGVQMPDGSIEAVYCHFDGYPQGVGHTLHTHHNSLLAAASILELGDLSYLAEKLAPEPGEVHKFGNAIEGVTVAYMRDRGETGLEARTFRNVNVFTKAAKNSWAEYIYLFKEGAWFYSSVPERGEAVWSPCFTVAEFYLPKMGRFYSGDIEGKFWFAVQDSVDAQHFGGTMDYLDEEGEVWEDGDEGQPVEVAFNFGPNDHDSIQKGLKRCEDYLGEFGPKIDEFFSNHETYTTEMLGKFLEVGEPQALDFLMVYARRELGRKIWECVQEKGECNFTGEL